MFLIAVTVLALFCCCYCSCFTLQLYMILVLFLVFVDFKKKKIKKKLCTENKIIMRCCRIFNSEITLLMLFLCAYLVKYINVRNNNKKNYI